MKTKSTKPAKRPAVKPPQPKRSLLKKIDVSEAIKLRIKGLTYGEIGNLYGITTQAVQQALKPYFGKDTNVPAFKEHRADLLAAKQAETLANIDSDRLQKASARDLAIVFGTLYDKERLERGQSTQNIAAFCASAVIQAHQEKSVDPGANEQQPATILATIEDADIVSDCND